MVWLKQCDTNFISDFHKLFPDYKIDIVYYLRRIDDYLRSLYSQCIKDSHGYLLPYGHYSYFDFCREEFFSIENSKRSFLPSEEISYLYSLVGKENVIIRLYDKNILLNGDIVDDFFSLFNISLGKNKHRLTNATIKSNLLPHMRNNILLDMHDAQLTRTIKELAERSSIVSQDVNQINTQFGSVPKKKSIKYLHYFQNTEIFLKIAPVTSLLMSWANAIMKMYFTVVYFTLFLARLTLFLMALPLFQIESIK